MSTIRNPIPGTSASVNASTSANANAMPMGTAEVKRILNLEAGLNDIKYIIGYMILSLIVVIILYVKFPSVFVKQFGYSLFLTAILASVILGAWTFYGNFKLTNKGATFENFTDQYSKIKTWGAIIVIAAIIIGLFFGILIMLGALSDSGSGSSSTAGTYITYIIFLGLLAGSFLVYTMSLTKAATILPQLPKNVQYFYDKRKKFSMILIAFIILISLLYAIDPGGVMSKYGSATIFLTVFIGLALLLTVVVYDYYFTNPEKSAVFKDPLKESPNLMNFLRGAYIVFGLGLSALFLYWIISALGLLNEHDDKSSKDKIGKIIVNIIVLIMVFAILYKLVNAGGYFTNTPLFRLIFNTILYIPCLLVVMVDFMVDLFKQKPGAAATAVTAATTLHGATTSTLTPPPSGKSPILFGITTKNDMMFLGISVSLCGLYLLFNYVIIPFGMTKYYKQGGKQLINNPVATDVLTNVATSENLNGNGRSYRYAISFWFYIDSFPPSTRTSYLKTVPILSYGDNPCVKYHGPSNSIIITVKQKTADADIVDSIQKLETNIKKENIDQWNKIQDKIKTGIEMVKALPIGNEHDETGNRIIYKRPDILLQKWNNIVLNYSGGTLDVFYNGELVKSSIEVVPKLSFDMLTVGSVNGISGNIANVMYFDHPLNYLTVNRLYTMLKTKNPPTISTIDQTVIPIPKEY